MSENRKWSGTNNIIPSPKSEHYGPFRHICEMGMFGCILFRQKGCEPAAYDDVARNVHSYFDSNFYFTVQ